MVPFNVILNFDAGKIAEIDINEYLINNQPIDETILTNQSNKSQYST